MSPWALSITSVILPMQFFLSSFAVSRTHSISLCFYIPFSFLSFFRSRFCLSFLIVRFFLAYFLSTFLLVSFFLSFPSRPRSQRDCSHDVHAIVECKMSIPVQFDSGKFWNLGGGSSLAQHQRNAECFSFVCSPTRRGWLSLHSKNLKLTPWSRALLEKLRVPQLFKKIPAWNSKSSATLIKVSERSEF